jgi:hypothetical protein
LFNGPFVYNQNIYEAHVRDAREELDEKNKKYQKLGTFNFEVSQAQDRLYSLMLKMGVIEIGADSELSQKMEKDAIDDAIKAAASSYAHGVVQGCNLTLIEIIGDMLNNPDNDDLTNLLLNILYTGYIDVYKTVLNNVFGNPIIGNAIKDNQEDVITNFKNFINKLTKYKNMNYSDIFDINIVREIVEGLYLKTRSKENVWMDDCNISVQDIIIMYSLKVDKVFDVSTFKYSNDIINSVETDENILKATIDLISLLMAGNQLVLTSRHNFE